MGDKLHILIPDGFLSEKLYTLGVLLKEYLNITYTVEINTSDSDYIFILPNGNRLLFKNAFFVERSEEKGYLQKENIPLFVRRMTNNFTPEKQLPVIFGTDELKISKGSENTAAIFGLDIIASTFFMLTRWEEYANPARDEHDRFPAKASCALKHNFLQRPVVNEYCLLLQQAFIFLGFLNFSPAFSYKIIPTHDVDKLRYFDGFIGFAKKIAGDLIKRRSLKQTGFDLKLYWQILNKKKSDPFDTYDELMSLSEENNLQSQFFFLTGFIPKQEPYYALHKGFGQQLLNQIKSRGHLIGLHGGYQTSKNRELFTGQLNLLNKHSDSRITINRQHFLQFDTPKTWQIANDCGLKRDLSLGYSESEGFRTGTCFPYPVYDFINRKKLDLYEQPMVAMDTTLVLHKKLSPDDCFNRLSDLARTVKRYNGEFVLLWHNSNWHLAPWQEYQNVYRAILKQK